MILFLPTASYSAPACVFPALSRRHKGEKEFYAKLPLVEFDVILCNVFFGFKKLIEKVISSILSWLRTVLVSLSSSSICDAVKQEILLTFSVLWKCRRIGFVQAGEENVSVKLKRKLHLKIAKERWREFIFKGL